MPLVIVPTSYPQLTIEKISQLPAILMVIYGNHAIRSSIAAMARAFRMIKQEGGTLSLEHEIASVDDVFRLQDMDNLRKFEAQFLR